MIVWSMKESRGRADAIAMNEQDSSEYGKEEYEPVALHSGTDGHDVSEK